jgi:hypothetical protein
MNFCCKRPGIAWPFCYRGHAHDPPKCERFGGKIMRFYELERDRTQNRSPLLLVALTLSGRFAAPAPRAGEYHEEKAT